MRVFAEEHTVTYFYGSIWQNVPIFHAIKYGPYAHRDITLDDGSARREWTTECGRTMMSQERPGDGIYGSLKEEAEYFPRRHAAKIGRPCKRCFPNG